MKKITLAPSKIRFMHDMISNRFGNGTFVNEVVENICQGHLSVEDVPRIRVVKKDGFYYTFDNRRLYVYRVLEHRGKLDKITVKLASKRQFRPDHFTTNNNGRSIRLCRGVTLDHAEATAPAESEDEFSDQEKHYDGEYYYDDDYDEDYDEDYDDYDDDYSEYYDYSDDSDDDYSDDYDEDYDDDYDGYYSDDSDSDYGYY